MTQHNKVYISIVDSLTTDYEIFKDLYKPKYLEQEIPQEFKITNTSNNSGRIYNIPNPLFINPKSNLIHQARSCYNESSENYTDCYKLIINKEIRSLKKSSWELDTIATNLIHLFNYDKFFDIDLEVHKNLIENHNYTPIVLDKGFIKSRFPTWLQETSSRYNPEVSETFFEWFDNIDIVFWKKALHTYTPSEGPLKDKKINSMYSELIFNMLSNDIINIDDTQNVIKVNPSELNLTHLLTDRKSNRGYWRTTQRRLGSYDTDNRQCCLNTFMYSDLSFAKQENYNSEEKFCSYIINNIYPKNKIKVIKVPSWKSKTNQTKIEVANYTTKQFLARQISFAGIVYFYSSINSSLEKEEIIYFSLISNACHEDLSNRSRTNERMETLFNLLFWNDGIKLSNPKKAKEILEQLYQGINVYSNALLEKLTESEIDKILEIEVKENKCFDKIKNSSLALKPKVNPILEKKYKKLHFNIEKHLDNINYHAVEHVRLTRSANQIRTLQASLQRTKQEIKNHIQTNYDTIKNIFNSANYIKRNKSIYNSIAKKYNHQYESSLENMSFESDNFFENLSKSNIKIIKLSYTDDLSEENHKTLTEKSSIEDLKNHTKASNYLTNYKIQELIFLIDHPVKIKVDSDPNKVHVGGPYVVKVSKNDLYVKLAYNYSLFGYNEGSFAVHPHVSTRQSLDNCINSWSRACLGEATSLIYKAFEKNDLKLIILSALTWVSSANSSDTWGQKYYWFIKEDELKTDYQTQKSEPKEKELKEEDVNDFLDNMFEDSQEEQVLETNQNQETWNPENFTQTQNEYTPFTQNNN